MDALTLTILVLGVLFIILVLLGMLAILGELRQKNNMLAMEPIVTIEYKEDEIIAHLDYIVTQAIDNYVLFHISAKQVYYINSKMEQEMIKSLQESIPEQLSNTLLTKLCYIYNPSYVGKFLGEYIFMKITDFVINFNLQNNSGAISK